MGIEIERKFLVKNEGFKQVAQAEIYHQGFLSTEKEKIVRIRIVKNNAWITVKGITKGAKRAEFEYEIPLEDAEYMIYELCEKPIISKKRYRIPFGDFIWEVDEFLNENEGLVIAEIELETEDQEFKIPEWIGEEVTGEEKYYNAYLIKHPYNSWK